jgi:hypothetical protein
LVNSNSATSAYVAKLYRAYYPAIEDNQVVYLTGLPDCSGPSSTAADEIITRATYNTCIAEPVRQHLLNHNLIGQIMVIVTTAGMPYRIEDTRYPDVIYAAGSNYSYVVSYCSQINAASVESELTCVWYTDQFGTDNRMVNPYQGYCGSSVTLFPRVQPGTKPMIWSTAITAGGAAPKMEVYLNVSSWPPAYGTVNRSFSAGDMYLTCRLDGPKQTGQSAVFSVRKMLERSKRASSGASGINPLRAAAILDDAPALTLDANRVYNLDGSMIFYTYAEGTPQPPNAPTALTLDDYVSAFELATGVHTITSNAINIAWMPEGHSLPVLLDWRTGRRTCQNDLAADQRVCFFGCYGKNGDEGSAPDYLTKGLDGGPLFKPVNGAVFTSLESFNAVTFFSNAATAPVAQGKIIDFISIGGSGAIGHAFEPLATATADNTYLLYNLFADANGDNQADLTFVEAAFTGIPFVSWAEVVIGDPLMRLRFGTGEPEAWTQTSGDVTGDGRVSYVDVAKVRYANGGILYTTEADKYELYNDLCDLNADGKVNYVDVALVRSLNGSL